MKNPIPYRVAKEDEKFHKTTQLAYYFGLTHIFVLLWFISLKVTEMVYFNLFVSIPAFIIAIIANRLGKTNLAFAFAFFELFLHQVLGTYFLGWNWGFHYWLFFLAGICFFNPKWKASVQYFMLLLIISAYVLLFKFCQQGIYNLTYRDSSSQLSMAITAIVCLTFLIRGYSRTTYKSEIVLQKANELLLEKNKEIEKQNEQLSEANADKNKFFSIISHDLKGPIGGLANLLNIIEPQKLSQEMLTQLQLSAQNTYELVEDLLTWARAQRGQIDIDPTNFNVYKYFEKIKSTLSYSAQHKHIQILIPEKKEDIFVYADIPTINTVLRNFVSNAIKFTDEGGSITLTALVNNGMVKISVTDTGVGIAPENLPNLFKAGSNISSSGTKDEKGTGLGLLLCKEFVELNNGEIGVDSELNKGSVFWITLPIGLVNDEQNIQKLIKERMMECLVVEDNYLNLHNTISVLSKLGINCKIAINGEDGINNGTTQKYDFILMDIDLPKINGIEVNKAIREKYPNAVIIALSSYNKLEILQKDKTVNFNASIKKPLNEDNITYVLRELFFK